MNLKRILTFFISGLISGITSYILSKNILISLILSITVMFAISFKKQQSRYMNAFYIVIAPLISVFANIYFKLYVKSEHVDFSVGLKQIDTTSTIVLACIATICLLLDFIDRKGKLKGSIFSIKSNKIGDINGNNNQLNQTNV